MTTALKPKPERLALIDDIELLPSNHPEPPEGCTDPKGCAEEICNWMLGLEWSDRTENTEARKSPVIASFRRVLQDNLPSDLRQQLKESMFWGLGTKGDGRDEDRAWMCADWAVRVALPMWLELGGTKDAASELRALPELTGKTIDNAQPLIDRVSAGAWERRREALDKLYNEVYAAVKKEFEKQGLPGAAGAAEAAGAARAAGAAGAAGAARAAGAAGAAGAARAARAAGAAGAARAARAAGAARAARAAGAAEAAGAARAARAAEAAGAAEAARAARAAVYKKTKEVIDEEFKPVEEALVPSAMDLLKRMCELEPVE